MRRTLCAGKDHLAQAESVFQAQPILTKFQSKQKITEAIILFYLISDAQITNAMLRASTRSAAVNKTGCLESVRTFPAISLNM